MIRLVDGKIPAKTECPWKGECEFAKMGHCHHQGIRHLKPYSCGAARAFEILDARKEELQRPKV